MHGSLSWEEKDKKIFLDRNLELTKAVGDSISNDSNFLGSYQKLRIVNPTKKKFEDTVLVEHYYDLLRTYSNELEKESTVLFVMGFSFADEHIRNMTEQVANSNPTLKIYIFSYSSSKNDVYEGIKEEAKNKNIEILYPESEQNYNLENITTFFDDVFSLKNTEKNNETSKDDNNLSDSSE